MDKEGNFYEGMFRNGERRGPSIGVGQEGTDTILNYPDGREYEIYHSIDEEYKDDFVIL